MSEHTTIIGVDPGLNGGMAILHDSGVILELRSIPLMPGRPKRIDWVGSMQLLAKKVDWALGGGAVLFASERLSPMPKQFGGGAANYARGTSLCWMVAVSAIQQFHALSLPERSDLRIKVVTVAPGRWQRLMLEGLPGGDTKQRAVLAVQRFWPADLAKFCPRGKYHDGLVDAALIAEWARRTDNAVDRKETT